MGAGVDGWVILLESVKEYERRFKVCRHKVVERTRASQDSWKCRNCSLENPENRLVCTSCARHRGSAPDIPRGSTERAQSGESMSIASSSEEEDDVIVIDDDGKENKDEECRPKTFKSPVFLSKQFSEVMTGRPSQHRDTSVPLEGESFRI